MESQTLTTEIRTGRGKTSARQLRAEGKVPAVYYGAGIEPISLVISPKELTQALSTERKRNAVLTLNIDGKPQLAMVKELQVHPVTREIRHVDLYRVELGKPVVTNVPFRALGKAKGVVAGGELYVLFRELPVRSTPDQIPTVIEVDVVNMELGDTLHVRDLKLAAGLEIAMSADRSIVSCAEQRKRGEEEEAVAGAVPGAPGAPVAAAAAAAPAAAAKPAGKPSK